jgi:hypothetical protein
MMIWRSLDSKLLGQILVAAAEAYSWKDRPHSIEATRSGGANDRRKMTVAGGGPRSPDNRTNTDAISLREE